MIIRSRTGQTAKVLTKKKCLKTLAQPIFEHLCVLIWKLVQLIFTATTGSSVAAVLVAQSCPTLCDPMNCSPPGSSIHGILQWAAIPCSLRRHPRRMGFLWFHHLAHQLQILISPSLGYVSCVYSII